MDAVGYKQLTAILNAVDKRDDVFCTVVTGKGWRRYHLMASQS